MRAKRSPARVSFVVRCSQAIFAAILISLLVPALRTGHLHSFYKPGEVHQRFSCKAALDLTGKTSDQDRGQAELTITLVDRSRCLVGVCKAVAPSQRRFPIDASLCWIVRHRRIPSRSTIDSDLPA